MREERKSKEGEQGGKEGKERREGEKEGREGRERRKGEKGRTLVQFLPKADD